MRSDPFGRARLWNVHARRPRLGQAEAPEVITSEMIAGAVPNRLSEISVKTILARHRLQYRMFSNSTGQAWADEVSTDTTWMAPANAWTDAYKQAYLFKGWTEGDFKALAAVANDPTEDELEDLALIDGFFKGSQAYISGSTITTSSSALGIGNKTISLLQPCSGVPATSPVSQEYTSWLQKYSKNPFFCETPQDIPKPRTMAFHRDLLDYFGIDPELPWEEVKPIILRAIAMLEALVDYPFPSPIDIRPQYWYESIKSDMNKFIRQDIIITKPLARMWITLSLVNEGPAGIPALTAWIIHDLEKEARDQKRIRIIQMVGMGATFAIFTAGLGYALTPILAPVVAAGVPITADAVASAVMSGVQKVLSAEEKKNVAETMDKVGQMYEADNAAFAKEAYAVRDTFNYMGEAMSDLTDEQKAAIEESKTTPEYGAAEVGEQYDVEPSNWPLQKKLLIGGGIAAAGVAAVLAVVFLRG